VEHFWDGDFVRGFLTKSKFTVIFIIVTQSLHLSLLTLQKLCKNCHILDGKKFEFLLKNFFGTIEISR